MVVIGLTGGIGTGKSAVSQILRDLGAAFIDADKLGHEAYQPHTAAWQEVVETFGQEVLQPSGEVDRKKLGAIVFSDPAELAKLNAIMHPKMAEMAKQEIQRLETQGARVVVLEAAVLIEANWTPLVDEVWVTVAPEDAVVQRIQARNGLPEEAIRSRIRSQLSQEERIRYAQAAINNDGDLVALRQQVEGLWETRIQERVKVDGPH